MSANPTAGPSNSTVGLTPEQQAAAFAADPRIHYDRGSGTWRLEDDDGTELEYDTQKGTWIAVVDEDLVKAQQAAYSVAGVDEETPAAPVLARTKKRKEPENYTYATPVDAGPSAKKGKKDKNGSQTERKSKNTAVCVTGLPTDTDFDELVSRFSRCGLIEEDEHGEPKVKMYAKENGVFSGEALVVYFKEDSVVLALNILDDAELRVGEPSTRMKVEVAEFGHKHEQGAKEGSSEVARPRKVIDKKKTTKRIVKMQRKLGEWDDEDGFGPLITEEDKVPTVNRNSRVVVLKRMFTLKELEEDASLLLDLKEDVRDECSMLGEVTNVVLYDDTPSLQQEPDGVMSVKFRDPLSAQACVLKMNGRFFAGRKIEAALYTGKQRFKRTGGSEESEGGGDEGEKKRLDDFATWLMTEGD